MSQIVIYPGPKDIEVALFDGSKMTSAARLSYPGCSCDIGHMVSSIRDATSSKPLDAGITCYGVVGQEAKPVCELTPERASMLCDGTEGYEQSNIGGIILAALGPRRRYLAYPLTYGTLPPIAVLTGIPQLQRRIVVRSFDHIFSSKSFCASIGKSYEACKGISVYLSDTEVSTTAHVNGEIMDATDSFDGEGPMTPTRSGFFHQRCVYRLTLSGKMTKDQLLERIREKGGMLAHLGTKDLEEARGLIASGDEKAKVVYEAMVYQIGKSIGKMAVGLKGKPDFFVFTGPLSHDGQLVEQIRQYVDYIGKPSIFDFDKTTTLNDILLKVLEGKISAT